MLTLDKKLENDTFVVVLGFFDSMHKGHIKVINSAKNLAKKLGAVPLVCSFRGNLKKVTQKKSEKVVFTFSERKNLIKNLGIKNTLFLPVTKEILSLSKTEFLDLLTSKLKVKAFVSGEDFSFGYKREGNVEFLKSYSKDKNISVLTVKTHLNKGEKVSTKRIKELLFSGKIKTANALLYKPFFIMGKVYKDRGVGKTMGFPTINVKYSKEKAVLKKGVYYGIVRALNKDYKAVINYGTRPTFSENNLSLEAHLLDFDGDLYEKNVKITFVEFIRKEKKFASIEKLKEQIKKDVLKVENLW